MSLAGEGATACTCPQKVMMWMPSTCLPWPSRKRRTPRYLSEPIPAENFAEMILDRRRGVWVAEIELASDAKRIDFFSNHRKTVQYGDQTYATYISSPYTRVETGK